MNKILLLALLMCTLSFSTLASNSENENIINAYNQAMSYTNKKFHDEWKQFLEKQEDATNARIYLSSTSFEKINSMLDQYKSIVSRHNKEFLEKANYSNAMAAIINTRFNENYSQHDFIKLSNELPSPNPSKLLKQLKSIDLNTPPPEFKEWYQNNIMILVDSIERETKDIVKNNIKHKPEENFDSYTDNNAKKSAILTRIKFYLQVLYLDKKNMRFTKLLTSEKNAKLIHKYHSLFDLDKEKFHDFAKDLLKSDLLETDKETIFKNQIRILQKAEQASEDKLASAVSKSMAIGIFCLSLESIENKVNKKEIINFMAKEYNKTIALLDDYIDILNKDL